jgi:hypothetical protein
MSSLNKPTTFSARSTLASPKTEVSKGASGSSGRLGVELDAKGPAAAKAVSLPLGDETSVLDAAREGAEGSPATASLLRSVGEA